MVIDRQFYKNMPMHIKLADELGLLEYFCEEGIQPGLDELHRLLRQREYIFDYKHPSAWGHLDYLAQFIFLGAAEDHWVGIGLNPTWGTAQKIKVMEQFIPYLKKKGTLAGVRKSIDLWGEIPPEQVSFEFPYETHWFDHYTLFNAPVNQRIEQRCRFGSGDYRPGEDFLPEYRVFEGDWVGVENWDVLEWEIPPPITFQRSQIGPRSLWEVIRCRTVTSVNQIGERIEALNLEVLPVMVDPCPWVVVDIPPEGQGGDTAYDANGRLSVTVDLKIDRGTQEAPLLGYMPDGFLYWDLFQISPRPIAELAIENPLSLDNGITLPLDEVGAIASEVDLSTASTYPLDAPPSRIQGYYQLHSESDPIPDEPILSLDTGLFLETEVSLSLEGMILDISEHFPFSNRVLIGYTDHFCSHTLIDIGEDQEEQFISKTSLSDILASDPVNWNILDGDSYYLILVGSDRLLRLPVSTITTEDASMIVTEETKLLVQFVCRVEEIQSVSQSILRLDNFDTLHSASHDPILLYPGISYLWEYAVTMQMSSA